MEMFVVRGGNSLQGSVSVSGAKNAALPIMAATILAEGPCRLHGVPDLVDVATLSALLRDLGLDVSRTETGRLDLAVRSQTPHIADYDLVRKMRASVCVLGPLLARRGAACVSLPGGCNIGERPIDLHLKGLAALGADIHVEKGYVHARANRLRGATIYLGGPCGSTVTGTCNVLAAATLAEGTTVIEAAACEPEVVDLGRFLIQMGARITGLGTPVIRIEGVRELHGVEYSIIPDRIEAGTLMMAAAITSSDIQIDHVRMEHLTAVIDILRQMGVRIEPNGSGVHVSATAPVRGVDCTALPFPGFPTDLQAQLLALLCVVPGTSVVTDRVFPDRFMHVSELARLGAQIRREGNGAIVTGVSPLSGACVMASDLRASAALVLAALAADGDTVIRRIYHLDRGYDHLDDKLNALGADIQRVVDAPDQLPVSLRRAEAQPTANQTTAHEVPAPHWLRRTPTRTDETIEP